MTHTDIDFLKDIERVKNIPLIATLLNVVCQTTGMGFAAVARVTQDKWVACSVRDDIQFGLVPGGELRIETIICNEIRDSHQPVIIDHVEADEQFCNHPTPTLYGFQSYISFPIILKNGEFFGTLCAIDPKPNQLETDKITGLFTLFTDLIALHLQQTALLERSIDLSTTLEQQVQARTRELQASVYDLQRSNENLQQFAYVASHDLQEPLRKIQSFGNLMLNEYGPLLPEAGQDMLQRMQSAAGRMSNLIRDLLALSRLTTQKQVFSPVDLNELLTAVLGDLETAISQTGAQVAVDSLPTVLGDGAQLSQLFQNLLSNALKFRRSGVTPQIRVSCREVTARELSPTLRPAREAPTYCCIEVSDNGIGFEEKHVERIFQVFQRLHGRSQYEGTGIGLAIGQKVVANHGGAITATSQPGEGATFSVYLPLTDS